MKIVRRFSYHRPLVIDNKYELSKIVFYNPETATELAFSNQGWLEFGTKDLVKLNFPDVKRKIKLDLTSKIPFFLKNKDSQYILDRNKYILYIPTTLVTFRDLGEQVKYETKTEIRYANFYEVDIEGAFNEDDDFSMITVQLYEYTRTETKDFGKEVDNLTEKLKNAGITLSSYDVEKLLTNFNVTEKVCRKYSLSRR